MLYDIYVFQGRYGEQPSVVPRVSKSNEVAPRVSAEGRYSEGGYTPDTLTESSINRFFLYPRKAQDNPISFTYAVMECKCLYRLENITLEFHDKITMVKPESIDGIVIQWMSKHGIDHVRGGSFIDPVLSDSTKEYISKQIKYMNYDLENNDTLVERLMAMTDISLSLLPEKKIMIEKCREIQSRIDKYYPCVSIEELEWLRKMIETSVSGNWRFPEIINKYSDLLKRLVLLYKQFCTYQQTVDNPIILDLPAPYLTSPHIYFDARVIPEERMRSDRSKGALHPTLFHSSKGALHPTLFHSSNDAQVFRTYELMLYTLLNRTDEMKFEIEGFDVAWEDLQYRYCMELISRQ